MLIVLFSVPINIDTYLLSGTSWGGHHAFMHRPHLFFPCIAREQGKGVVSSHDNNAIDNWLKSLRD